MKKQTLAIGHVGVRFGGSEATLLWLMEALKRRFEITLITTNYFDLAALNSFYGTTLRTADFKLKLAPVPFFMRKNLSMSALRGAFYARYCRKTGSQYDLCISAYNVTDWGRPAMHFLGDLSFDPQLRRAAAPDNLNGARLIHRENLLRKTYLKLSRMIAGKSATCFGNGNLVMANSQWMAKRIAEKYGYQCSVMYPPVAAHFPKMDFRNRREAFVSLGRVAPEKRLEEQIVIMELVRAAGHELPLHIIGHIDENEPYGKMIAELCRGKDWIVLEGRRSGRDKVELLTGNRYALHTCGCEAFGITVAEFVKAGMLPFVPDTAGAAEILQHDRHLCFHDAMDASKKICAILENPLMQAEALARTGEYVKTLASEHFQEKARKLVDAFLNGDY